MDAFEKAVERAFGFLEAKGFRRRRLSELESPVGTAIAFEGARVGILIGLDARDAVIDVRLTRVDAGGRVDPGGASRDLFTHLVERGYRGRAPAGRITGDPDQRAIEEALAGWADLLRSAAGPVLEDDPEALPPLRER
jgi:hypothetical protein